MAIYPPASDNPPRNASRSMSCCPKKIATAIRHAESVCRRSRVNTDRKPERVGIFITSLRQVYKPDVADKGLLSRLNWHDIGEPSALAPFWLRQASNAASILLCDNMYDVQTHVDETFEEIERLAASATAYQESLRQACKRIEDVL